ncbi:hypothetical protein [Cohnella kolymensis]|nr:hypothetical protein [Cohnella kolymensis]
MNLANKITLTHPAMTSIREYTDDQKNAVPNLVRYSGIVRVQLS